MLLVTALLSLAAALAVDWLGSRHGLLPPGFRPEAPFGPWRRSVAAALLALLLWVGVFGPLVEPGEPAADLGQRPAAAVFALHGLIAAFLLLWWALGYLGLGRAPSEEADPLRLRCSRPAREVGVGLAAGAAGWLGVLVALLAIGGLATLLGERSLLPTEPPPVVPWIAGLPVGLRLAVSLSAGLFEELFFRAFLQPRLGVVLSSAAFVLAHAAYEQPMMLIGVSLLSLLFAGLLAWRGAVWAAVVAHTLFDAVQLLVVVPLALELLEAGAGG
ncbi:MAG: lysostaphin resistance A-like protein [Thermoanaerobaculia bacterium]